jgi:hypothetical protein
MSVSYTTALWAIYAVPYFIPPIMIKDFMSMKYS